MPSIVVMSWLLPVALVATILSGLFDAMVRYRKIATPALLQKQIMGYSFLVVSLIMVVLVSVAPFTDWVHWMDFVVANLVAMVVSARLGIKGPNWSTVPCPATKS